MTHERAAKRLQQIGQEPYGPRILTRISRGLIAFLMTYPVLQVQAENYYQSPSECRSPKSITTEPKDPGRFLGPLFRNQGDTLTCGPHTGVEVLTALVNLLRQQQRPGAPNINFSVNDALRALDFCSPDEVQNAIMNPVSFFLKLRKQEQLKLTRYHDILSGLVVNTAGSGACTAISLASLPMDLFDESKRMAAIVEPDLSDLSLPRFNIDTWDSDGTENPDEVSDSIFNSFKNPSSLPLAFLTCRADKYPEAGEPPSVYELCPHRHIMTLVGVEKKKCSNGTFYNGIFKNSWGTPGFETYDLSKMMAGMIRHRLGYSTLHACSDEDCNEPPFIRKPDQKNSNWMFHLAEVNDSRGIEKLLKSGLDPNRIGAFGRTPLLMGINSAEKSAINTVNALLRAGANPNKLDLLKVAPLYAAATRGDFDVVRALLASGADPNLSHRDGTTPLLFALRNNHGSIVDYLLASHADPNSGDSEGLTPLHMAAYKNDFGDVQVLLRYKANPNILGFDGGTPLHLAIKRENLKIVDALLRFGADPKIQNNNRNSALNLAAEVGHVSIVERLLKEDVDLNLSNSKGMTPLFKAIDLGRRDVVRALLRDQRLNLLHRREGKTASDFAKQKGLPEISDLIDHTILERIK